MPVSKSEENKRKKISSYETGDLQPGGVEDFFLFHLELAFLLRLERRGKKSRGEI